VTGRPDDVDADATARAFLAATLASCLEQVLGNATEVAAGREDAEFVHQLRVGLRRLRTALRELGTLGDPFPDTWEGVLRAAFQELGAHRDTALVVPTIAAELGRAGAPELAELPAMPARRPRTVVRDPGFQRTLLEILARTHALGTDAPAEAPAAASDLVARRLDALHRQVVRDAKRFGRLDAARQHRVRKRLKRLRYHAEFAAPLFGAKRVERYLAAWKDAQDALGAYNDTRIASEAYRAAADRQPAAWFAVGWLEAGKDRCVKRCRRALRAAGRSEPFWD
jgi:CHAD domain-containing protein